MMDKYLSLTKADRGLARGGSTNSSTGGSWAGILQANQGGCRVQVRGNFHIGLPY